jgi:hypothetical protein
MSNEANIKRLAEIQQLIATLTREGMQIADKEQVKFYLGNAPFANNYGSGGLEYYPDGDGPYTDPDDPDYEVTDQCGESVRGQWMSSNSWGC